MFQSNFGQRSLAKFADSHFFLRHLLLWTRAVPCKFAHEFLCAYSESVWVFQTQCRNQLFGKLVADKRSLLANMR